MNQNNNKIELVRLTTAGSVDDGKSTMIGRLLHDCHAIYEDQLLALEKYASKVGGEVDLALLTDGLSAEREQGITIDVAYRYFSTPSRRFIIADVPGHEQYTRNMVTGASKANVAIILVDARKGLLPQSKRHLFIASLLQIPHILVAINKMDLVNYDQAVFERIKQEFTQYSSKLNIQDLQFIPLSAKVGDMVVNRGETMPWYEGRTIFDYLENLQVASDRNLIDFRFPIQMVLRPNQDFRGYAGQISSGVIKPGSKVTILPSGKTTTIKAIHSNNKEVPYAFAPQSVVITLTDEIDASRGDMIVKSENQPDATNNIEATLTWMSDQPMKENASYLIKHTSNVTRVNIDKLRYKLNIDDLHRDQVDHLALNDIGRVLISSNKPLLVDPYSKNRQTGNFILIDELTNNTVAAGMIVRNIHAKEDATPEITISSQKKTGAVLWFTGLSGAGKSTIADALHKKLEQRQERIERLDGDTVRQSLTKDLGFTAEDRNKNIERVGYVAELLSKHGVLVLASFISPYRHQREHVKNRVTNFIEIFVDAPLNICEDRDVKGMYAKARRGEIENFTGVSAPFENPANPHLHIKTHENSIDECVDQVIKYLEEQKLI